MLTELKCKSNTHMKNAIVFYYIHMILYFIFFLVHAVSTCGLVLFIFVCYTQVTLLNCLKSLTSKFSTFVRDLLARRKLCTAASRESGLAAKWCWLYYDEAQDAVFCFICVLWYTCMFLVTFRYFT